MDSVIDKLKNRKYFFDHGLRFECQRCGICCTGEPGIIYVNEQEITVIASFIDVSREVFVQRCLYPFQDSYSIMETNDGRCIFYENGCAIYPVRPVQCRTFPFWFQNVRSEQAWEEASIKCPGIGRGPVHSKETILDGAGASFHIYQCILKEITCKK
jgi:Fe-S-cluster containining protein